MNKGREMGICEKAVSSFRQGILELRPESIVFQKGAEDMSEAIKHDAYFIVDPLPTAGKTAVKCEVSAIFPTKNDYVNTQLLEDIFDDLCNAFVYSQSAVRFKSNSYRIDEYNVDGYSKVSFKVIVYSEDSK